LCTNEPTLSEMILLWFDLDRRLSALEALHPDTPYTHSTHRPELPTEPSTHAFTEDVVREQMRHASIWGGKPDDCSQ
jgi:hypothetical protein